MIEIFTPFKSTMTRNFNWIKITYILAGPWTALIINYISIIVDNAYACDPRLARFKAVEKERKESEKRAKREAARVKVETEDRVRFTSKKWDVNPVWFSVGPVSQTVSQHYIRSGLI